MALQARAVTDRKDLGEAIGKAGDDALDKLNKATPPDVGRALSYPSRKLYETITGKEIGANKYSSGGMVKAGSPKVSAKCADTKVIKCS